jgi:hypothetical protein
MTAQEQAVAKAREKLKRKTAVVQRVLATADGQEMMKYLRDEFLYALPKESPHGPGYRVGTADVIAYLMQMNDFREE